MSKKSQLPPPVCIFCGHRPLSDEHLWPMWMREIIPLSGENKHKAYLYNKDFNTNEYDDEVRHLAGHAATRKLKLVCRTCNSGWMGDLEREVGPILTPLILGQDSILSEEDQSIVAEWAVLKTIIGEHLDIPRRRVIGSGMRKRFYESGEIEPGWKILLGKVPNQDYNSSHGAGCMSHILTTNKNVQLPNNTQYSQFTVGCLLIYTYYGPYPENLSENLVSIGKGIR